MTAQDIFYFALSMSFLTVAGCTVWVAFYLVEALKSLKTNLENLEETTKEVNLVKDVAKLSLLQTVNRFLGIFLGRR